MFCGRGGWSKAFAAAGWECVGVDLVALGYPFTFIQNDVRDIPPAYLEEFDAVIFSPPCEDFARAHLPWLRGDFQPSATALGLLRWSVSHCMQPCRLVECSRFASKHVPGAWLRDNYALWGDVPTLLSVCPRTKMRFAGQRPDLRAEIPALLAVQVEKWFSNNLGGTTPETLQGRSLKTSAAQCESEERPVTVPPPLNPLR